MCVLLWVSEIMLIYRAGRFQPIPEITIPIPIPDLSGDSDSDSQISGPIPTPKIFTDSDSSNFFKNFAILEI